MSKLKYLEKSTKEQYVNDWKEKIKLISKLNYYKVIRKDYNLAPYLIQIKNYHQRKLLTKYRLSDHNLAIEKGRHRQTWVCREHRICKHCNTGEIEDEGHFLTKCTKYHNIRETYYRKIEDICPEFIHLDNEQKIPFLLGEIDTLRKLAAEYLESCHILREECS